MLLGKFRQRSMPAGRQFGHGGAGLQPGGRNDRARLGIAARKRAGGGLLAAVGAGLLLTPAAPARAGLLGPLLQLLRPQLESRLAAACEQWASGGDAELAVQLRRPCAALAAPASRCLIEESERDGRSLALIGELAGGRLGEEGERVVKRCISRQLGLPADTLRDVPLRALAARWRSGKPRRTPVQDQPLPEQEQEQEQPMQTLPGEAQSGRRP